MASRLRLTLVLSSVILMGCGGAPADVRAKVALFQQRANAGQLAEIRRELRLAPSSFDYDMAARAKLGRMNRTTEASVMSGTSYAELVIVFYNTEFERGHALETFTFRVDSAEPQLERYFFQPGKRMWCPMITISAASCSTEDVPATMTSSR
jgi:hypothetical protein